MNPEKITLPSYVADIIDILGSAGFDAYAVGGCVRDFFLSKPPEDWDVATSAEPERVTEIFSAYSQYKVIPTGIKHGTVTVISNGTASKNGTASPHGTSVEITTYRIDGNYTDNRRPEEVTFCGDIALDLARRDFTINALAYNNERGTVDEFGGIEDIKNKVIRCVGEPDRRFGEDALRIMRALRFASVLGFAIEEETAKSIHKNKDLLRRVSAERISTELLKLLCGDGVTDILLQYRDVIAVIIPELVPTFDFDQNNKHHIYTVYDHIAYSVGYSDPEPDIRLALLLHDIGKPDCYTVDSSGVGHFYGHGEVGAKTAEEILHRLRLPREFSKTVKELVEYHDCPIMPTKKSVRKYLGKYGETLLKKLMQVRSGDSSAHNPKHSGDIEKEISEVNRLIEEIISDGECFCMKDLLINGKDIEALGCPRGRDVGEVLRVLLSEVIDGQLENTEKALSVRAEKLIREVTEWNSPK